MSLWISNPFAKSVDAIISNENLKNDLIEVKEMSDLKRLHSGTNILEFWASHLEGHPNIATDALRVALPFVATYHCEAGFSTMVSIKTKRRSRLDASHDMRLALSTTEPMIDRLMQKRQEHKSPAS